MSLPKVLLLGDSIRMSYQPHVYMRLDGRADVVGPADNSQYSLYTLSSLERWLSALGRPDIVHWNNGLHDAGHNPRRRPVQIPLSMYRGNLAHILARLREITPHIIWATTTPVHPRRPFTPDGWSWRNEEIDRYNVAACRLMRSEGVVINDLHAVVREHADTYLDADQLHLSPRGQKACAQAVVRHIETLLSAPGHGRAAAGRA